MNVGLAILIGRILKSCPLLVVLCFGLHLIG
nr:MAG TPA: hypothetical protein [Bacteriophage sp.]